MTIIPFPEPEEDPEQDLANAHMALIDAIQHKQDKNLQVTVVLDLEEALQLVQLIERSIDPAWFTSDEEPDSTP